MEYGCTWYSIAKQHFHNCVHIMPLTSVLNEGPLLSVYLWLTKPWWRHQLETFSALLAICAGNSPITGESHAQRPVTRSFDVFSLIRVWINGLLNNREAGDLRRYGSHYDNTVMQCESTLHVSWTAKWLKPFQIEFESMYFITTLC